MWSFFMSFLILLKAFPESDIEKPHWFWNPVLFVPFLLVSTVFIFTHKKEEETPYTKIG